MAQLEDSGGYIITFFGHQRAIHTWCRLNKLKKRLIIIFSGNWSFIYVITSKVHLKLSV